jgi:tetratricopeptide (TPR) repeat protein/tRNA A-37 threonylcarbamoyl transferase component Bud32
MIGKEVLHYRIREKLGEGGMAAVYLADDTKLHRQVALKFLPAEALEREEDHARFEAEARAAAALDHPNICTVYEINEADSHVFISMAYIEGRDLKSIIDGDGPMSILDTVKTAVQIAEGLAAAHEKDIVHRDIKSANVMLTPKGQAKIMDFGLAYRTIGERPEAEESTLGTIAYASPEQARGDPVDRRGDIWSFGVMLYEMLTGELPFKGDYESAIVYSVMNEAPAPPRELREQIPEALERIVLKALSKKPSERYQSAEEMLDDLIQVRNAVDPTISSAAAAAGRAEAGPRAWLMRVFVTAGVYLGSVWLITQLVRLIVGKMQFSHHLVTIVTVGMLSLLPAVLIVAFFAARRRPYRWGRPEWIGVPVNLVATAVLLVIAFEGKDLGAVTKQVEVTNEEGETIERTVPTGSFRKNFELYLFEDQTNDAGSAWLKYALPLLLEYDVVQDPFLHARSAFDPTVYARIKEAGFNSWDDVPFALKRKIAGENHMDHFVTGIVERAGEEFVVTVEVFETQSSKRVAENTYRGSDIFAMADEIAHDVIRSVDVPLWHLDGAEDMPVAEIVTKSKEALRELALAHAAIVFDSDWSTAITRLEAATEIDSTLAFAYFHKSMVYRVTNRSEESLQALDAAIRHLYKVPERMQFIIKANYYMMKQQPDKVLAVTNMMTELYPDDVLGYQTKAEVLLLRNEIDAAIAVYERIIELEPFQYDHLKTVGLLCQQKGDYENALRYYRRYAEFNPNDSSSFQRIGDVYRADGDFDKARENYDRALLIEPEKVSIMIDAARNEKLSGRFDEGFARLGNALRASRSPDDSVDVYAAIADYYETRGQFNKSIEVMQTRLAAIRKTAPDLQYYLNHLGDIERYVHAGRTGEALDMMKQLESVLLMEPFDKALAYGYLAINIAREDPDKAETALAGLEEYIQALGLEVLRPHSDHALAKIHEFRGEYSEAVAVYERLLERDPSDYAAYRGMGRCRRLNREYDKALANLEKLIEHRPYNALNNYELGLLYHEMGRGKDAVAALERALDVWENADPEYRFAADARAKMAEWQGHSGM